MIGLEISGKYKIIYHLGGGAYGQTYLAGHANDLHGDKFLVKQLKPVNDPINPININDALIRFEQEANILTSLGKHHSIPSFIDFVKENNQFYIIQEFINGKELEEELSEVVSLGEERVYCLLIEILETLSFVHENEIIHRDIKPSNIICRALDGKPILVDFGAIKNVATKNRRRTVAIGTEGYMPNEQANGNPRLCSDIYSLGLVAIRALLGYVPQENFETGELDWKQYLNIKPEFEAILEKMTFYDFRERYSSASEALDALRKIENKLLIQDGRENRLCLGRPIEQIWFERANLSRAKKLHVEAISLYLMAVETNPQFYRAWFNIGITLNCLRKYEDSEIYFTKATTIKPNSSAAWIQRGLALLRQNKHSEMTESLDIARTINDASWLLHLCKGLGGFRVNQIDEAQIYFAEAIKIRPSISYQNPRIFLKSEIHYLDLLRNETIAT